MAWLGALHIIHREIFVNLLSHCMCQVLIHSVMYANGLGSMSCSHDHIIPILVSLTVVHQDENKCCLP